MIEKVRLAFVVAAYTWVEERKCNLGLTVTVTS